MLSDKLREAMRRKHYSPADGGGVPGAGAAVSEVASPGASPDLAQPDSIAVFQSDLAIFQGLAAGRGLTSLPDGTGKP